MPSIAVEAADHSCLSVASGSDFPRPEVRARRSECLQRAQCVSPIFPLRALTPRNLPQALDFRCCSAAAKPVIDAKRDMGCRCGHSQARRNTGLDLRQCLHRTFSVYAAFLLQRCSLRQLFRHSNRIYLIELDTHHRRRAQVSFCCALRLKCPERDAYRQDRLGLVVSRNGPVQLQGAPLGELKADSRDRCS